MIANLSVKARRALIDRNASGQIPVTTQPEAAAQLLVAGLINPHGYVTTAGRLARNAVLDAMLDALDPRP